MAKFSVTDEGNGIVRIEANVRMMNRRQAEGLCNRIERVAAEQPDGTRLLMDLGALSKATPPAGLYAMRRMKDLNLIAIALFRGNAFMRAFAGVVLRIARFPRFALFPSETDARAWLLAAPAAPKTGSAHRRIPKTLAVLNIAALGLGGLVAYQVGVKGKRSPSFSKGGGFGERAFGSNTPGYVVPSVLGTRSVSPGATVAPSSSPTAQPTGRATQTPPGPSGPGSPVVPGTGVYTYAVSGWEEATGFGRRDFPPSMTMTVHRDASLNADELVFDLAFSAQHEEREIVAFRRSGVAFTFEGGSVTFGPMTQTSEASYRPPMTQVPHPPFTGVVVRGTSDAVAPDNTVSRTEDWTVTALRTETIRVLGADTRCQVVRIQRKTKPGGSESVDRTRTYWYDPARGLWVKWVESMKGERRIGATFTYTEESTVTLSKYEPR